jgi:NADPH:quinone reductase-like Zn-dependent oxidoreductase
MKAMVYREYGSPDVLKLEELEKPSPGDGQVLVKIHAVSINIADWYTLTGKPFLVRLFTGAILKPKNTILGFDIAGTVASVGAHVKRFKPGDEVFGDISAQGGGGLAEYAAVSEEVLVLKPAGLSFEQAAAVPMAAVTALQALRGPGAIKPGQQVLVHGASGGVGTYAVQIAKALGAEVTAVVSTSKMDMVRSIGADHAIDYTREDFTRGGRRYDLIIGANGNLPLSAYRRALKPAGIYVCTGGGMAQIFQAMLLGPLLSKAWGIKMSSLAARPDRQDLDFMKELLETRKVVPLIDRRYTLSQAAEAFRYLGGRHAAGKVVISLEQAGAG